MDFELPPQNIETEDECEDERKSEENDHGFGSDNVEYPEEQPGETMNIGFDEKKIVKELVHPGTGFRKPGPFFLVQCIYELYFESDGALIESTNGAPVDIAMNDPTWPYGLRRAVQHMRKTERAKIILKGRRAFANKKE